MFKKFKDKLTEEVKSSPQRIQQFAQAAQAAVTSASSSISDITNNDLFSIGDNDASNKSRNTVNEQNMLKEVSLMQQSNIQSSAEPDYQEMNQDNQRQRRLSNSSFASDISFRLPSYESPSMYHLQSDMEVSASEAEDRGFSGATVNLDRVTKDQLYSAYRRTQDRCTKYKTQYADLARHYKLLERENAKAKNVLVETQDKALRRISELREQCSLEQSAKAHLEKALRIEIEEKNLKIDALNTKLNFFKNSDSNEVNKTQNLTTSNENDTPLITLSLVDNINEEKKANEESIAAEITVLNNKLAKMEQLLNKYKDSLKISKEKNGHLTTELQLITTELDTKIKENDQLKAVTVSLTEARQKIQELNERIEELQNKNNSLEFLKSKELSILESNFQDAQDTISELHKKIEVLSKREEEYAISLAENKLSIHKELEGKENEIKSLKESLTNSQNEIHSLNIILSEHKNTIEQFQQKNSILKKDINELRNDYSKVKDLQKELDAFMQKSQNLETLKSKSTEEYKCLELQLKQENAEKLAMIDRNVYLENRNAQLHEENTKKNLQISHLENELQSLKITVDTINNKIPQDSEETKKCVEEINMWKSKCSNLESEIQDERNELEKLQSEIEKLLTNHELVQKQNEKLNIILNESKSENNLLKVQLEQIEQVKISCENLKYKITALRDALNITLSESKLFKQNISTFLNTFKEKIILISDTAKRDFAVTEELKVRNKELENDKNKIAAKCDIINNELVLAQNENDTLKLKIKQAEADGISHSQEMQSLNDEHKNTLNKIDALIMESEQITKKMHQYNEENLLLKKDIDVLRKENEELQSLLKPIIKEKEMLEKEFSAVSQMCKEMENNANDLNEKNTELLKLKEENLEKSKYIFELEKNLNDLKEENVSLKNLSDTISKSVIDIELELKDVQKSHSQIESEKDHLISVIDDFQKKLSESKQLDSKNIQTELLYRDMEKELDESNINKEALENEIKLLKETNTGLSVQCEHSKIENIEMNDVIRQQNATIDAITEDNRRLQSDIEGLQTHITKVSKENSQLSDKLREFFASADNISEKKDTSCYEMDSLKNEIQIGQDKIDSLVRENSILVEENLELKDQIKSQSYTKSNATSNETVQVDITTDKYKNLLDTKNKLEIKLSNLELMNESANGNVLQMQANNEKLRLSNEKLERRLDEALVSLRHLHSLQENTELEYLKNILYEYLTGSGTHSVTLAKVLSAVVKFDDKQTDLVLQKEKERQGFLRQLGII